MLSLLYVGITSIIESTDQLPNATLPQKLAPFIGTVLWSFLMWKIWTRLRRWGVWVGGLLFFMIAFQCYLWNLAIHHPRANLPPIEMSTLDFVVFYEVPIFIAGTCCVLLSLFTPKNELRDNTRRPEAR